MRLPRHSSKRHYSRSVAMLSVFLATACGQQGSPPANPPATPPVTAATNDMRNFTGDWTVTGNRYVLDLLPGQQAGIFRLSGSMLLSGKQRLNRGFQAEAIGFTDTTTGMQGRSVWIDEHGDKVFSEISGEGVGPGQMIEGKFTGGTGRYTGISGEYSFKWQRLGAIEGDELAGRVVGLNGWARLGSPNAVAPTTAGGPK
jgi:hypothetical protein